MLLHVFDMFHILLSGNSLRDLWNVQMYVCIYLRILCTNECVYVCNHLKTKRRLLYLKTQSVPRCKHFSSRL